MKNTLASRRSVLVALVAAVAGAHENKNFLLALREFGLE